MKKLGETELLKGQSSPTASGPKLDYHAKTLRELTVHFFVTLYQATQSVPTFIEPALILFNLVCVVTSHIELGQILMVGASDSVFTGYIVQLTGTWMIFAFGCFVYLAETKKAKLLYLLPSYKPDKNRQTYILAIAIQVQTYLFTPRLSTVFLLLMGKPELIWPGITNDAYYWGHLAATGISTMLGVAIAFVYFSYCKLPIPGNRNLLASNSVINEVILMVFPVYAFLTTTITKELFILRRSAPFLVIMLHIFKSMPAYVAIFANLTSVIFYNRPTRELLVWVHMLGMSAWALILFIYDVSPKYDRFLSLMMCLLAPMFITSLVRLGAALDSRVSNPSKLSVVIALAEICLLEASGKLSPLEDKKAEYLKNYYFHQDKLQKLGSALPLRLSEAEKLIIAVFEHLLTRTKAKSGEVYLFFLHYLIQIDAGVLLPLKVLRKLATDNKKQTLKWSMFYRVITGNWQAKLDSMTLNQELFKIGKSDFSNLDCSPINPHLALIELPVGFFGRRNLDALLLFDRLTEFMQQEIKLIKEFYSMLTKSDCEVGRLQKLATKIHEANSRCQSVFDLVDNSCPGINTFHLLPYAMFCHHTSNNNRLMRDLLHQFHLRKKSRLNPRMNLPFLSVKEWSSFFVSSAETATLGDIIYSCGKMERVLTGSDSKNIFTWLPDGMQMPHKGAMTNYLSEMDKPYLGVKMDRILRIPGSSIYLPHQMVSLFGSSLKCGLQFFLCIEESSQSGEFLLFDDHHRVCGLSSNLARVSDKMTEGLVKRSAADISAGLLSMMQAQSGQPGNELVLGPQSKITLVSGTTGVAPSEISTLIPGFVGSPLFTDGELMLSFGGEFQVSCKMKEVSLRVLALPANSKTPDTSKTAHYQVTLPKEVLRQVSRLSQAKPKSKFPHADKKFTRVALFAPDTINPQRTYSFTTRTASKLHVSASVALFVVKLRRRSRLHPELLSLGTFSRDADSFGLVNKILFKGKENQKKKSISSEQLLAKFDQRFARATKEEMDAADSINTHKQIMYDARSMTIRHISPKSIILWPIIGLSLVILAFWIGMVYCYYLEVIYMGGKAATLLDARLVQSLLVKSRWSVWQTIDGVVEKISYDKKYLTPDRFKLIGIDITRDWNQVYLEGAQRWPQDQINYLLQVEKLPQTSIDTINQFVYKTNITLGTDPNVFITKSLTLSNILYFVSYQVRKLYKALPKVDFKSTDYAKAITLIEDGSPATVSKYADQIVVVEGNKFAETQLQISTTVTAIMLVSEGLALCITVLLWLICARISDVYQSFTLLEDREIQFKKDRLEHFERSLSHVDLHSDNILIKKDQKDDKAFPQRNILAKRMRKIHKPAFYSYGLSLHFLPLFLALQLSLFVLFNLTGKLGQMLEVQNHTTTHFRSFGKMMYQHRSAYHMIFEAVLIKAGVGKNVTITAQLTKLTNILTSMKSFQSDMERFFRQNQLTDTGRKFSNIAMIFDPCGLGPLGKIGLAPSQCVRLADGTLGQDFMSVMNWAISTTDHFLNAVRNAPKEQVLALLIHQKYLNLEYLVKKFYYPFYTEFASRFKESMQADQQAIQENVGRLALEILIITIALSICFACFGAFYTWKATSVSLNSLKYLPDISLLYNAHLKLRLKKYAPKYA